jgi:hypothetical protein
MLPTVRALFCVKTILRSSPRRSLSIKNQFHPETSRTENWKWKIRNSKCWKIIRGSITISVKR